MTRSTDLIDEVNILRRELEKLELEKRIAELKTEPSIDEGLEATIKKQNQILLHIKAELEAIKQHPFDAVLINGSIENIFNIIKGQTEPIIDGDCAGCCKVADVAAKLQEELESTRNMYRSSSDECCGQRKTIGDLRTKIWELERTLPANFWDVVAGRDATIRKQRTTIRELNDENLSLRVTINDMAKKHIWYKNTIEELKDGNIEDLKERYDLDKKDIDRLKHVISARDLSIKSLTSICQSGGSERNKLTSIIDEKDKMLEKQGREISGLLCLRDMYDGLSAELSARKGDSEVLKKVVDVANRWSEVRIDSHPAMNQIAYIVKDCLDAPEVPPDATVSMKNRTSVTFAFLELP